jgi:putative component of toxin-antitoxin plasmid stabilization module
LESEYVTTKDACQDDWQRKLWDAAQEEIKARLQKIHVKGSFGDCEECFLEYYPCPTMQVFDSE